MAYRSDMDQYGRACETLENWEVSQMGGLKRRRGMRALTKAASKKSRLIPYIYTYENKNNERFLVELTEIGGRVYDYDGNELYRFKYPHSPMFSLWVNPRDCKYKQINNLLILTNAEFPPMVLKRVRKYDSEQYEEVYEWLCEPFDFKNKVWRYVYEQRDHPIVISQAYNEIFEEYEWNVKFDEEDIINKEGPHGDGVEDYLRASFWTELKEARDSGMNLRANIIDASTGVPEQASVGDKFVVASADTIKYFVCTVAWSDSSYYMPSLDSPANYPNNFIQAEGSDGFESVVPVYSIHEVKPGGTIAKGTKIAIKSGYWEYYTCIKDFVSDGSEGKNLSDYPDSFIKGIAVGDAIPCQGEWSFYSSGVWFGSYEIRRNYDTSEINDKWEKRGESFSRNEAVSNILPSGSEADEICYLRLFLTRSKRMAESIADDGLEKGFPQDSCNISLMVQPFKYDMILKCIALNNGFETVTRWVREDNIQIELANERTVYDWSWQAFSSRYGYPRLCDMYNKRLVFAATTAQPQTIWMSKTDDLNNFATYGSSETAAMALTLNTTSQNPICWLHTQGYRLMLGTSEAEYSISAGQSQAGISNSNVQIEDHSHVGSDGIAVLTLNDAALFVERGAGRVYSLQYSFQIDGYTSQDISVFAPHIAAEHNGIVEMSSIRKPDMVGLFVLGDGQLALCTYNKFHEINAWHRWVTPGVIVSACGMPNGTNNDKIFLVVDRGEEAWIEVIDSESGYMDNGRDYTSLLVLNAMIDYREGFFGKRCSVPNYLCLGADFKIEDGNIYISDDGGKTWLVPVHQGDGILHKGWNKQYTPSGFKYEVKPSVKVTGNQGIHILGLRD